MTTVVLGHHDEIDAWLERRRSLGADGRDEVWNGDYHVAPPRMPQNSLVAAKILGRLQAPGLQALIPFNLGLDENDFRCPDGGWVRVGSPWLLYMPTAVAVLEVLLPDDETYDKFPHYAERGVDEILVAHPFEKWIRCHRREGLDWRERDASELFGITMSELEQQITWP